MIMKTKAVSEHPDGRRKGGRQESTPTKPESERVLRGQQEAVRGRLRGGGSEGSFSPRTGGKALGAPSRRAQREECACQVRLGSGQEPRGWMI